MAACALALRRVGSGSRLATTVSKNSKRRAVASCDATRRIVSSITNYSAEEATYVEHYRSPSHKGFTPPCPAWRRRAHGVWCLVLSVSGRSALARRVHRRRRRGVDELECMGGCALVRHSCFDFDAAGLAGHLPCDGRTPWFLPESRRYSRYLAWGWAGASVLRRRGFRVARHRSQGGFRRIVQPA